MKAIELTQEQKNKLLEMCKILFPELIFSWDLSTIGNGILFYRKPYKYFGYKIHWFEFCITQLIDKISFIREESRLDVLKSIEFYRINDKIHLVDYLYSIFQKLNK